MASMTTEKEAILRVLRDQSCELRDLDIGFTVPRISCLSALEFYRDYIACNKPVIFEADIFTTGLWPARTKWTKEYLLQKAGDTPVTVALTPNGRADCPTPFSLPDETATATENDNTDNLCFALPCYRKTSLATFFNLLEASNTDESAPVPYMQFQNSSLTAELPQLVRDVGHRGNVGVQFATEAFGCPPEAVNIWIGNKRTITSFHQDHYENLYAVISGKKSFRLLPPTDVYRMKRKRYPIASWQLVGPKFTNSDVLLTEEELENSKFELKLESPQTVHAVIDGKATDVGKIGESYTIWSGITPTPINSSGSSSQIPPNLSNGGSGDGGAGGKNDLYNDPTLPEPLIVTLYPGDMLYLPACWWHEVHHDHPEESKNENKDDGTVGGKGVDSSDLAIAVNFWYNMHFGSNYVAAKTAEALAVAAGLCEDELPLK